MQCSLAFIDLFNIILFSRNPTKISQKGQRCHGRMILVGFLGNKIILKYERTSYRIWGYKWKHTTGHHTRCHYLKEKEKVRWIHKSHYILKFNMRSYQIRWDRFNIVLFSRNPTKISQKGQRCHGRMILVGFLGNKIILKSYTTM